MKKIKYFVLGTLIMLVLSCSNNKEFVPVYRGQIDEGEWINTHTVGKFGGVKKDYCSKIDSVNQYSYGFKKLISEISPDPIKKVNVSVWVKINDTNKKTSLVISLDNKDGKNIFWSGHEVNPITKETNKWYKIDVLDVFPEDYEIDGAVIGVYVWNPNNDIVYVDDFEISFPTE